MTLSMSSDCSSYARVENPSIPEDYLYDGDLKRCYFIEGHEYACSNNNEEMFAAIDDGESALVAIRDDSRLLIKGDFDEASIFRFLFENNYADNSNIYLFSNNDFDMDKFKSLMNNDSCSFIYQKVDGNATTPAINISSDAISLSCNTGEITRYEIEDLEKLRSK